MLSNRRPDSASTSSPAMSRRDSGVKEPTFVSIICTCLSVLASCRPDVPPGSGNLPLQGQGIERHHSARGLRGPGARLEPVFGDPLVPLLVGHEKLVPRQMGAE